MRSAKLRLPVARLQRARGCIRRRRAVSWDHLWGLHFGGGGDGGGSTSLVRWAASCRRVGIGSDGAGDGPCRRPRRLAAQVISGFGDTRDRRREHDQLRRPRLVASPAGRADYPTDRTHSAARHVLVYGLWTAMAPARMAGADHHGVVLLGDGGPRPQAPEAGLCGGDLVDAGDRDGRDRSAGARPATGADPDRIGAGAADAVSAPALHLRLDEPAVRSAGCRDLSPVFKTVGRNSRLDVVGESARRLRGWRGGDGTVYLHRRGA